MWGRLRCVQICSLLAVNCCVLARVAEDLVVGHGRPRRALSYFVAPAVWTGNLALRIFGGVKTWRTDPTGRLPTRHDQTSWCYALRLDNASLPQQSAPIVELVFRGLGD